MSTSRWIIVITVLSIVAWVAACGSADDDPVLTGTAAPGPGGNGGTGATTPTGTGSGGDGFDAGGGCKSDQECNGGVCMPDGSCCPSEEQVCGAACCEASMVCLFEQCVVPGDPCLTAADCPDGHYCEPALGDADGGMIDAGPDANCTQPLPANGRCVPLPPICGPDAGADAGCIEPCEYHPPVGQLKAVRKWQWGYDPEPAEFAGSADVWATPTVARIYDANCDGKVDLADPPNVVFVSGDAKGTCCSCGGYSPSTCLTGVLRMLDGRSGEEIWSLDKPMSGNLGFAGMSVALGDVDGDQNLDIVAMSGGGYIVMINALGEVERISDARADGYATGAFGWGGGISIGDMDGDGYPEIAYGRTLFDTTGGAITRLWVGTGGVGGGSLSQAISYFVDLDGNGTLELQAGRTAYRKDGSQLWHNTGIPDGLTAIGDFDQNSTPEVVHIRGGVLRILNGADGTVLLGPLTLPGTGSGGPPTVADFDGDGKPEIGVAQQNLYSVLKPNFNQSTIEVLWSQTNHDMSSSVTGSSVFDFEGDGKAEVIYNDECYLWVYDGTTGDILYTDFTQSFTATEASMMADVDGDGHAEMLIIANGASPTSWTCAHHDAPGKIVAPHTEPFPVWEPAPNGADYRGITVLGDAENSWVGTRTLWNQHAYHVTNICDPRDSACAPGAYYGQIPPNAKDNWQVPWLNNFRQNVQDEGVFDAPDVTVSLNVECVTPVPLEVAVRNLGLAGLPEGVEVGVYKSGSPDVLLAKFATTKPLLPGQTEVFAFETTNASTNDAFFARILVDPLNPTFHECREDNNESPLVAPNCVQ